MSPTPELRTAGIVVGEASSNEFYFASETEDYPSKWEYLLVKSDETIDGQTHEVQVVAQVDRVVSASEALTTASDFDAILRIIKARIEDIRTWGVARILGYAVPTGGVLQPRRAVKPSTTVYIAPKELLEEFYSYPEEEGLHIGHLITRDEVPVYLSVQGLRRHLAIIAQTGAGKSYCTGVLVEELLRKGASVVVLDPHSDYVLLSLTKDDRTHELSNRIMVFRNPASTGRYSLHPQNLHEYTIAFNDLSWDEVCDIAGITASASNQREAVRLAIESFEEDKAYTPRDLLAKLEKAADYLGEEHKELIGPALASAKYVRNLVSLGVFGTSSTPITDILKAMQASVIDLSGLKDEAMDYIASTILAQIYQKVTTGDFHFPAFLIIEEAHKLIPRKLRTYSASIINKIAAEGRKFGIFMTLITQRPFKVNPDSLSQCNSQIIMKLTNPTDQQAVAESSERMSVDLLRDLPGLNPGEAVIVGDVTRAPVMIKVRPRLTKEGGADIDIVKKLEEARRSVEIENGESVDRRSRGKFKGELTG